MLFNPIQYHFATPWLGLLGLLVLAASAIALHRKFPTLTVSTYIPFNPEGKKQGIIHPLRIPTLVEAFALICLTIALMRPQHGIEETVQRTQGVDIIMALDVSGSMQAYDSTEDFDSERRITEAIRNGRLKTRLETAKTALKDFITNRPEDRIGLIGFARYAYVMSPPTLDHEFLIERLQDIQTDDLPDGTGIAAPMTSATKRLKESDAERRVLVLFTDGRNNVDSPVSPRQAAQMAEMFDITVYTVGVGSTTSVIKTSTPFGDRFRSGLAGYNEELLRNIAAVSGGKFYKAKNADKFQDVMSEIDEMEKTTIEQTVYTDYEEKFFSWTLAGIAFLLIAFTLRKTILQPLP
ncbi:MAG: VWA domain-containing protein [Lentisphaeria bacterium]